MKSVLGVSFACLMLGVLCLFQSSVPVGAPTTQEEISSLWAGACYDNSQKRRTVCASDCGGTTSILGLTETTSGNSLENTGECDSEGKCKYDVVGDSGCGGG